MLTAKKLNSKKSRPRLLVKVRHIIKYHKEKFFDFFGSGQKATLEVELVAPGPLTLFDRTKNNVAYCNGTGRCCLIMNRGAVAIGIITKLEIN